MKTIELGEKYDAPFVGDVASEEPSDNMHYPTIWIDGKAKLPKIPDSGEAIIKFKVVRRGVEEHDGEKRHSMTLEVHSLTPTGKGDKETESDESDEDVVEKSLRESEEKSSKK